MNITKGLTVVGDELNPDNVVIDGQNSTSLPSEGQVRIYNPTGPVVLKGFKIINGGANAGLYVAILTKGSQPRTIEHCSIIGHGSSVGLGDDYGLWAYTATGALTIRDNYFHDMYHGILLEQQYGAATVENNTFDALYTGELGGLKYGGRAIEAIVYGSTDVTSLQTVRGNQFVNFKSTGVLFSGGFMGETGPLTPRKFTNVVIENNNFDFATTDITNLFGAINLRNVSGTLNDNPAGGVSADIHNNIISVPSGSGIIVTGLNGAISVNNNSITGNLLYGIKADGSLGPTIAATCNWWGSTVAADVLAEITGNVDPVPWLIDGTDGNAAIGFQPTATCTGGMGNYSGFVDLQGRSNDAGATIQVYHQALKSGATLKAQATSASSGAYATAYVSTHWIGFGHTYWLVVDRALYLPTTPLADTSYADSKLLDTLPLTALVKVVLLGGDATNDDNILVPDLSCIGGDYGGTGLVCGATGWSDVNGDGIVNVQDLSMAGGNLYKTSSPWTP